MSQECVDGMVLEGALYNIHGAPKLILEQGCMVGILSRFQPDGAIPVPKGS